MPATFTFDIEGAEKTDWNRIQSAFEQLGWQHLGGSSYRYDQPTEDWLNHVIPALMLFRSFILSRRTANLKNFTLDLQGSTSYSPKTKAPGAASPLRAARMKLYQTGNTAFGKKKLKLWLDNVKYPY